MRTGEQGRGGSAFRTFLRGLPDEVAVARERGQPVTFPAAALPAAPARRRAAIELLAALGVELVDGRPPAV